MRRRCFSAQNEGNISLITAKCSSCHVELHPFCFSLTSTPHSQGWSSFHLASCTPRVCSRGRVCEWKSLRLKTPLRFPMSGLWRAMTIKQLFATEATERKKKERMKGAGKKKKQEGAARMQMSLAMRQNSSWGTRCWVTHTPGGSCTAVMHVCRQVGLLIMQRRSDPAGDPDLLALNYVPQGS